MVSTELGFFTAGLEEDESGFRWTVKMTVVRGGLPGDRFDVDGF